MPKKIEVELQDLLFVLRTLREGCLSIVEDCEGDSEISEEHANGYAECCTYAIDRIEKILGHHN